MKGTVTPILYFPFSHLGYMWSLSKVVPQHNVFPIGLQERHAAVKQSHRMYKVFGLQAVSFNMGYKSLLQ